MFHKHAWAKTSVDMIFKAAIERRHLLEDEQKARVENLWDTLQAKSKQNNAVSIEKRYCGQRDNDNFKNMSAPNY